MFKDENLSLKELLSLYNEYYNEVMIPQNKAIGFESKLRKLAVKYYGADNILNMTMIFYEISQTIMKMVLENSNQLNLLVQTEEAVNVIRTARAIINMDYSDENFRRHMISLFHDTSVGCIGQDKNIPDRLVQYSYPEEW